MNIHAFNFPDRVRYFLWHAASNRKEQILDPKNWDTDNKSMSRDKTFLGIKRKTADNLFFAKNQKYIEGVLFFGGYDFINDIKNIGVNEDLVIIREERDNETNVWKEAYRSDLDLLTYSETNSKEGDFVCTLKSSDAGLDSILKARKGEDMEITREFALDDSDEENPLAPIDTKIVELKGRKIELINSQENTSSYINIQEYGTNHVLSDIKYTDDPDNKFQTVKLDYYNGIIKPSSIMIYVNDGFPSIPSSDITILYDISITPRRTSQDANDRVRVFISTYNNINNQGFTSGQSQDLTSGGTNGVVFTDGVPIILKGSVNIDIPENGAFSLAISKPVFGTNPSNIEFDINKYQIGVTTISQQETSTTKAYKVKDAFNKYAELMTGKSNLIRSDFLDSVGKYFMITDGALVRNIPVTSNNPNARTHQLETSFEDIFKSFDATWNLSVGIEREGFKEFIRIEQKEYFFNPTVVLELGELTDIKRTVAKEYIYSGTNISYEGEAKIEGIQGLDKTSGEVNRITTMTKRENVYEKKSKFQSDDYPREVQRRKQFLYYPTEDVKYDDTKMILDCQIAQSYFEITINTNTDLNNREFTYTVVTSDPIAGAFNVVARFGSSYAIVGATIEESAKNLVDYLSSYQNNQYMIYTSSDNTVKGQCIFDFAWNILTTDNGGSSMTQNIFNAGNDINDEIYKQRTSLDDFIEVPAGVYDPEGLTNGRWTPLAMTLRHGNWIRAGLESYSNSLLSFGSSNSNTQLKGILKNDNNYPYLKGIEYSESSDINVSDLEGAFFTPEWITGNHPVTKEIMDILEGSTVIDGKEVKNFYCRASFINREGIKEYGYIFDVKPNGKGTWKFLSDKKLNN